MVVRIQGHKCVAKIQEDGHLKDCKPASRPGAVGGLDRLLALQKEGDFGRTGADGRGGLDGMFGPQAKLDNRVQRKQLPIFGSICASQKCASRPRHLDGLRFRS